MVGWAGNWSPEGQCLVPGQLADGLGWRVGVGGGEMGSLTAGKAVRPGTLGPSTWAPAHSLSSMVAAGSPDSCHGLSGLPERTVLEIRSRSF